MIKFESKEQVIDTLNAVEFWFEVFQARKDELYIKMECFDDPQHLIIQLDYYCDHHFKAMLYNIRLRQAIKWYLDNSKSLEELNDIINDVLDGKTYYLVLIKEIEEDEIPF